jgi:phosphoribosylaminoimidazole-succinocarboxamide synthase
MMSEAALLAAIPDCLVEPHLDLRGAAGQPATKYTGKVRDTYDLGDGRLVLVTTDRQSGFDRYLGAIPFKGQVLNRTSLWWFARTREMVPNHVLGSPHANVLIAKKCRVCAIEFVIRGYLTGSTDTAIWTKYNAGQREFGGITLGDGMRKNEALPQPLLTPTTKEATHDRPIAPQQIVSEGWMTQAEWDVCAAYAMKLFRFGQQSAAERGLILVDTKYEFGVDEAGEVLLIDEVHTPDSSRYWLADSYEQRLAAGIEPEMIDKEFFRLWFRERCDPYADATLPEAPPELIAELASRYIQLFERITGETFVPETRPLSEVRLDQANAWEQVSA